MFKVILFSILAHRALMTYGVSVCNSQPAETDLLGASAILCAFRCRELDWCYAFQCIAGYLSCKPLSLGELEVFADDVNTIDDQHVYIRENADDVGHETSFQVSAIEKQEVIPTQSANI